MKGRQALRVLFSACLLLSADRCTRKVSGAEGIGFLSLEPEKEGTKGQARSVPGEDCGSQGDQDSTELQDRAGANLKE